jgi:hypothetical protein
MSLIVSHRDGGKKRNFIKKNYIDPKPVMRFFFIFWFLLHSAVRLLLTISDSTKTSSNKNRFYLRAMIDEESDAKPTNIINNLHLMPRLKSLSFGSHSTLTRLLEAALFVVAFWFSSSNSKSFRDEKKSNEM